MRLNLKDPSKYDKYFRNVHVLENVIRKFGRMNVEEEEWRKLIKTLEAMLEIRSLLDLPEMPLAVSAYISDENWQEVVELCGVFKSTL